MTILLTTILALVLAQLQVEAPLVEGVLGLAVLVQLVALVRQAVVEEQEVVVLPAPTEEEVEALVAEMEEELHQEGVLLEDQMVVGVTQPLDKVKVEVVPLVVEQPKEAVQPKGQLVDKKTQQPHQVVNPKTHQKVEVAVVKNKKTSKKK
jgi:hypothetical protein